MATREKLVRASVSKRKNKAKSSIKDRVLNVESANPRPARLQEFEQLQKYVRDAQQDLEEFRTNFSVLYDRAPIGYLTLDRDGRIHRANTAAADLLGFDQARLRAMPLSFLIAPEDLKRAESHLSRCGDSPITTELRVRSKKRGPIPVQLVSLRGSSEGQPVFFTALIDLSVRQRHETALAQTKEFSESIVDTIREPLAVLDSDFRIISVNRAFAEFFKRPAEYVKGRVFDVLLNLWWSGNTLRQELEKTLIRNQPVENFELKIEPHNIGKRVLLLNARRLYQKESSPPLILVALEDITARKQAEEQLRIINEELEKRVEARTDALRKSYEQMEAFCYSIAHDLRAPLRAMTSFSFLLEESYGKQIGSEGKDYTERIRKSAERMDNLIKDLLDYGRLNTVNLPMEDVDLERTFQHVHNQLEREIKERQAKIRKPEPLPHVHGHRVVLEIAMMNLITNALKFVLPGVLPKISVWTERVNDHIRLWVGDNGIGIAPQNQDKIFGVFQRLHGMERYPGTGIGLALVSKGMERIGGRVGVESELGQGSRFWIELQKPTNSNVQVEPQ